MIISRTPYRVSFFGGGTDMPQWFEENGGAVISTTIDKYCYISCRSLPPFFDHKSRVVYSDIELVKDISDIKHPSVRECLKFLDITNGIEIHHDGDLPSRSGLGSSSSFTVGLLNALYAYKSMRISKNVLAHNAIMVERQIIGEVGGLQDQIAASYGGLNKISFLGNSFDVRPIPIRPQTLKFLQDGLALFFTGKSRTAETIEKSKLDNLKSNGRFLKEMMGLTEEGERELCSSSFSLANFGRLLNLGWSLKRRLSDEVSTPLIDQIYLRAIKAGAYGGKVLGAGGGGFVLFCVEPHMRDKLIEALRPLTHVPFKAEYSGSQIEIYHPESSAAA